MTYKIVPTTYDEFNAKYQDKEGLVMLACGAPYEDWPKGIAEMLIKDRMAYTKESGEVFEAECPLLTTTGGRHDIALIWKQGALNIGKLAIWRIAVHGTLPASWISDYLVNYRDHHAASEDEE